MTTNLATRNDGRKGPQATSRLWFDVMKEAAN
jgi:hypothetical protein